MIRAASTSEIPLAGNEIWREIAETGVEVLLDFRLACATTMRLGGTTSALVRPGDLPGLVKVLKVLDRHSVDFRVLGCGSNLVVATSHLSTVVLHTRKIDWIVPEQGGIRCGGGASLVMTIKKAIEWGFAGLEKIAGIPATVGGAVAMNAGGRHAEIGDFVRSVTLIDRDGTAREVPGGELEWRYRGCELGGAIVAEVRLALERGNTSRLRRNYEGILREKGATQPLSAWTAGCIFKNHEGESAGLLIDQAGLKGLTVGGTQVSPVHANFIVNTGQARPGEFLSIVEEVRGAVSEKFGIGLDQEVIIWK